MSWQNIPPAQFSTANASIIAPAPQFDCVSMVIDAETLISDKYSVQLLPAGADVLVVSGTLVTVDINMDETSPTNSVPWVSE